MASPVLVLGTGSIGQRHQRVLERAGVPVVAWSARGPTPIADAFGQGAHAAVIATSTGRHLSDATAALATGHHLLVEKPLAASTVGLAALERAAADANRDVFVGCCLRFHATLRAFRAALPRIAPVHHVRIECVSHLPDWRPGTDYRESYSARADEGGVLRDLIHEIDYAGWLFGWPAAVTARIGNTGHLGIAAEEWADLLWDVDGTTVSVRLDYLTKRSRREIRADGAGGTLEADLVRQTITIDGETTTCTQERDAMMTDQATAFLAAISGGDRDSLATLEDGGRALAIVDAARSSLGTPVMVRDWRVA